MRSHSAVIAVMAGVSLAACASGPPPATGAINRAQLALERAEQVGASRSAADDLNQARDKLQRAQTAERDKRRKPPTALDLAQQAQLDAEVAEARSRAAQAQAAADELQRSLDALRQETQHEQTGQEPGAGSAAPAEPAGQPELPGPATPPPTQPE